MENLIDILPAQIGSDNINSVNSRDLYTSLELGKGQYSRWINKNLVENDFFYENKDYIRVRQDVEGNPVESFIVSLDVAKHLSMMSKTSKAHEFRNYFIEVEKESKKPKTELELIIQSAQQMQQLEANQIDQEKRIENLEDTKIVNTRQRKNIKDAIAVKIYGILKDNNLPKTDARAYFPKLHKYIRNSFTIDTYQELPSIKYDDCMNLIHRANLTDLLK